ncbi:MAG: hypothetical protein ACRDZ1_16820 [Acidimicrobiia bacterium]
MTIPRPPALREVLDAGGDPAAYLDAGGDHDLAVEVVLVAPADAAARRRLARTDEEMVEDWLAGGDGGVPFQKGYEPPPPTVQQVTAVAWEAEMLRDEETLIRFLERTTLAH